MEAKTPLYEAHLRYGAKMVPYAGYLMPVQYKEGIIKEHMSVRTAAGLFDVSHMGEFIISGSGALAAIQELVTNDCAGMREGQVKYSPMCNESGGVIDDLLVFKKSGDAYMLVVNAANREKDSAWIRGHIKGGVAFSDISDQTALIALQGPHSQEILEKLAPTNAIPSRYYTFAEGLAGGAKALISRTGYTGEDGFEIYTDNVNALNLWEMLMEAGNGLGLAPCGLGARDTLRLEAAMPLYGHELSEDITPFEAGLKMFVKMDKEYFVGKPALEAARPGRIRAGLALTDKGIAREGCSVYDGDTPAGVTTSGTMCPYIGRAVCMALVEKKYAEIGTTLSIDVRGRKLSACVVKLPFYSRAK